MTIYIKQSKFNILILGDSRVGKTSVIVKKSRGQFEETTLSTVGIDYIMDEAIFDGKTYRFKIFDTAGQERFKSISGNTIKASHGFFVVFALNDIKSFQQVKTWITTIEDATSLANKPLILLGNKCDLKRKVDKTLIDNFIKLKKLKYYETSAKTGQNIKESFEDLYQKIYNIQKNLKDSEKNANTSLDKENHSKGQHRRC